MAVKIRPIALKDAASYRRCRVVVAKELRYSVEYKAPPMPEMQERLRKTLRKNTPFLVAVDEELVVGVIFISNTGFPSQRHLGEIQMFILPEYRGMDLETKLMVSVLKLCRGKFESVLWWVFGKNRPAQQLSKKMGFEPAGRLMKAVRLAYGLDDLVLMQKRMHGR